MHADYDLTVFDFHLNFQEFITLKDENENWLKVIPIISR